MERGQQSPALPQPARLCAADALPEMRPSHRMPAMFGDAGGAPLPPAAQLPSLRLYAALAEDLPEMRRGRLARSLRPGGRARRRGGRGAFSGRRNRDPVERSGPRHPRPARHHREDRARAMRRSSSAPSSSPRAIISRISPRSASSTAISALPRAIRARLSAPFSSCRR